MKVSTEKLPKSLVALDIELDREQVEKGLDRAARRLSQKYNVPGFRKGKAPRFIIENYFGRDALMEEASEDLINTAFKAALEQEQINPVGPAALETVSSADPFIFRVTVPVPPTVTLPDYRAIRETLTIDPVTDETVQQAMDMLRDKHVVLKELDEPRPSQVGDQLTAKLESIVDGETLEQREEGEEIPETTLVLEQGRLVDGLYEGLLGVNVGDEREITVPMPEDHSSERVRGKEVTFKVQVLGMQERILTPWDELPALEEFSGTIDELRTKTREDLETSARSSAERKLLDSYIEQLVEQTEFDVPDVLIRELAEDLLEDQGRQFERYGVTLDQMLEYRGKTRDEAVDELLPEAERQFKVTLALQEIVQREKLNILNDEIETEVQRLLEDYKEEERPSAEQLLSGRLRSSVANVVLDRKLRNRIIAIAAGEAPDLADAEPPTAEEALADAEPPTAEEQPEQVDAEASVAGERV